jgi:hypothetical protein
VRRGQAAPGGEHLDVVLDPGVDPGIDRVIPRVDLDPLEQRREHGPRIDRPVPGQQHPSGGPGGQPRLHLC